MFKQQVHNFVKNYPGFSTKRKLIVIESDDWGSIRIPSLDVLKELKARIPTNILDRYQENDTLADETDLTNLFEVLISIKDINGNAAKITPVAVVANPDYRKIKESGFSVYHYELFTDHLIKAGKRKVIDLWHEGISAGIFMPQYHGREHVNVTKWMKALQQDQNETMEAFQLGMYGIVLPPNEDHYLTAYDYYKDDELNLLSEITIDGLNHFENIFGYRATYFVPPNGALSSKLNAILAKEGIKAIQTARMIYKEPIGSDHVKKSIRYFGMKEKNGITYTLRNAFFEPSDKGKPDWVSACMKNIEDAFKYGKPAVISSHRVNYMGTINTTNRDKSLLLLKKLLKDIQTRWPDIEFLTSAALVDLIYHNSFKPVKG